MGGIVARWRERHKCNGSVLTDSRSSSRGRQAGFIPGGGDSTNFTGGHGVSWGRTPERQRSASPILERCYRGDGSARRHKEVRFHWVISVDARQLRELHSRSGAFGGAKGSGEGLHSG